MALPRILLYLCLFFILGIFLNSFLEISTFLGLCFLFLGLFLLFLSPFWGKERLMLVGFCFLFLFLGIYKHQIAYNKLERSDLEPFFGKDITLSGYIVEEPETTMDRTRIVVEIPISKVKILVTTDSCSKARYGDKIKFKGILKEPPVLQGFNYKDYLKNKRVYFLAYYPEIEIQERASVYSIKAALISVKNKLKYGLAKNISFSYLGMFEALIWGDESNISQEWKDKLNITGVRHVAAVSGANITIFTNMLLELLLFLGCQRRRAFWFSLALITAYILMIGAPACAIRAGVMAGLFLFSQHCGRLVKPERILVFALAAMLFFNPLLLKTDIGFQLSFLAVLGLIYFCSLFSKVFKKLPNYLGIRTNLCSTLSAQIFVLPILLYNFGRLSLVSPVVNVLILPFIPYLTIIGLSSSLVSVFSQRLSWLISLPGQMLLGFIMKIIDLFSCLPFAAKQVQVSGLFVFISYLVLAVIVYMLKKKQRLEFLDY